MKLWWLAAKTTGPSRARTCSSPSTRIQAKSRVMGSSHTARAARRSCRTGHAWLQRGAGNGGGAGREEPPPDAVTSLSRSATVAAPATPRSSTATSSSLSSVISSSTRSSELRPSSSRRVPPSTAPPEMRARIDDTDRSPPPAAARAGAPPSSAHVFTARRMSFRVPSVRGSRSPGHTSTSRTFWWSASPRLAARATSPGDVPGASTATAYTRSLPSRVRPTTADSSTPGTASTTRSTSSGKTLSPSAVTIISFLRPCTCSRPASSRTPRSPVWNQPSSKAASSPPAAPK